VGVRRVIDVQGTLAANLSLVDGNFSGKMVMAKLTPVELKLLDPYTLLAVLGKKVIRPGGLGASEKIFRIANFQAGQNVLDIGCGVGTTAIQVTCRFGCHSNTGF